MNIISSESFTKIEPLIPENHVNVHARLRQWLGEEDSKLFAYPDFPSANSGQWGSNANDDLKRYADASAMEKEEIAIFLENSKNEFLPKLTRLSYAPNIFRVPTENQIFWYRDNNGQVKVVLAQWGFKQYNTAKNVDVIDFIISQPRTLTQTEVNVHVIYSDGNPAANETFTRFMFNNQQEFTTDDNGSKCFGKMYPNQKFSVSDNHGATCKFVVEKDKTDYEAHFDLHTSYQIAVVNQLDEPMPDYNISIDNVPYTTDADGAVAGDDVILTPSLKIFVSCADGAPEEFTLSRDAEQNKFVYKIRIQQYTSYTIKVVNQDSEPKPNYSLNVNGENHATDASGILKVNECTYDEGKKLIVTAENGSRFEFNLSLNPADNNFVIEVKDDIFTAYTVKVTNQKGEAKKDYLITIDANQYKTDGNGIVAVNNVLWEEGKQITVIGKNGVEQKYELQRDSLSNNFIYTVEDKQIRIKILDFDGTPLDNIMVYVDTKKGTTLNAMSDSEGWATFPAEAFEHGKKAKVHFKVSKEYRENREQQKKSQKK